MPLRWSEAKLHEWITRQKLPSKNKYGAKKSKSDEIEFDSVAEKKRYHELKIMQRVGLIGDLRVHPVFLLVGKGIVVKKLNLSKPRIYTADFVYTVVVTGAEVIEDVKGVLTAEASLRISMFEALYDKKVTIIKKPKK